MGNLRKAFAGNKEVVEEASDHIAGTEVSIEVHRIKVAFMDLFEMDYTSELKAFMVIMACIRVNQPFEVFKNSFHLNSCSS